MKQFSVPDRNWVFGLLHTVGQKNLNSLNLRDVRRSLDDAAGESRPCGVFRSRSVDIGSWWRARLSGVAWSRGCAGHWSADLGQTGESHSGVDLPPVLVVLSLRAPVLLAPVRVLVQFKSKTTWRN